MRRLALAVAVALIALAAILLSRGHMRPTRADPGTRSEDAPPGLPVRPADAGMTAGAPLSPIAPPGPGKPETFAVEVVSSPGNRPVAGARVEVWENERVAASAITDGAGLASLTARRAGGTLLVASCRGFVPTHYWLREEERETPTVLLRPGLVVDGIVTFAETELPAAGAEIVVLWPGNTYLPLRADARGRFEIPGVAGDAVTVKARLAGYEPAEVEYAADPASPHVEIVLGRGGTCEGRVVDEANAPVPNASVRIGEFNPWYGVEMLADADGGFIARGLAGGKERRVHVHTSDHRSGTSEPFTCDDHHPVHRCEIVVRPYARVAVTLTFPDGSPVAEANVAVSAREGWGDQRWCAPVAGSPGAFESGQVEPGENELRVGVNGWPFQRRKIAVLPHVLNEIAFRLEDGHGIEGLVVDREGNPVRGIDVDLYEAGSGEHRARITGALTDALGRFRMRGLGDAEGTLACAASDARYMPVELDVRPGRSPLRIVLDRRPRIVGRLDPVPESRSIDASIGCDDEWAGGGVRVGRDGRFEVRDMVVPAGRRFWLRLDAGHDVPWIFLGLDLAPNETLDLGTLRPPAGVTIEGVVTDHAGKPLANAEVVASVEIENLDMGGGGSTDAMGRFAIADLADIPFEVHVSREGYAPWKLRVERPSGAPPLMIALDPGGALEVAATPWDVEGVDIEAVDGSFRDFLYTSKEEPSVVWLKPGAYRVNSDPLEIRVGETTRVDLRE